MLPLVADAMRAVLWLGQVMLIINPTGRRENGVFELIVIYEMLYLCVPPEGAILSQMMEVPEVQYSQSFVNISTFISSVIFWLGVHRWGFTCYMVHLIVLGLLTIVSTSHVIYNPGAQKQS